MHESVNIDAIHTMLQLLLTFRLSTKVESSCSYHCVYIYFLFHMQRTYRKLKGFSLRKGIINNTWFIDKMFVFVVILKAR